MKKITTFFAIILTNFLVFSQQINDGYASVISDLNLPIKSGVYNALNPIGITPDGSHPWQHVMVLRHTNDINNFQLQIASSFAVNDRLFFRKISAGDLLTTNSAWIELATRGGNIFEGNQIINGDLGIRTSDLTSKLSIGFNHGILLSIGNSSWANKTIIETGWNSQVDDFTDLKVAGDAINNAYVRIVKNGNVGIGVAYPKNKLDVDGTIHSKEVKVDMIGWSDFVFKKEYNLPTLEEVEKHISEKGYLKDIPNEEEVLKNGVNLGEMNAKLLQKIEELTLYMIEMKKEIELLKKKINNKRG